ncbi:hypothetical protein NDU88_001402 [Pleurodeles waltl]|uniref:Uncharacterized protein n=1 Tax=Pleurodeles waltl TaxID=8319 RepID=A0AAV7UV84_PLEWA|nr:hypothetical protein NDU88_001402 [Pleurodeles waltl]
MNDRARGLGRLEAWESAAPLLTPERTQWRTTTRQKCLVAVRLSKIQQRIVAGTVGVERCRRLALEAPGLAGTRETVPHERCCEWLPGGLGGVVRATQPFRLPHPSSHPYRSTAGPRPRRGAGP